MVYNIPDGSFPPLSKVFCPRENIVMPRKMDAESKDFRVFLAELLSRQGPDRNAIAWDIDDRYGDHRHPVLYHRAWNAVIRQAKLQGSTETYFDYPNTMPRDVMLAFGKSTAQRTRNIQLLYGIEFKKPTLAPTRGGKGKKKKAKAKRAPPKKKRR